MNISIVIPVYNSERYIDKCIQSVLEQTMTDFELIVIDDGSSDNSGRILDNYAQQDSRIKIFHIENSGVSAARNYGIEECKGDYIYIMDSDDYLEENALMDMYCAAIESKCDVVISDHYVFTMVNNQKVSHYFSKEFFTMNRDTINLIQKMVLYKSFSPFYTKENIGLGIAAPWNKLIKREVIIDNHLLFDPYVRGLFDDGLFCIDLFECVNSLKYIREPTYHYRITQSSLIHQYNNQRINTYLRVYERLNDFCIDKNKTYNLKDAINARKIQYLGNLFKTHFLAPQFASNVIDRYNKVKTVINETTYAEAIKEVNVDDLLGKQKVFVYLLRFRLLFIVFLYYKVKDLIYWKVGK